MSREPEAVVGLWPPEVLGRASAQSQGEMRVVVEWSERSIQEKVGLKSETLGS